MPHKAVAEVSKIGNLQESLVVVNHGWVGVVFSGVVTMVAVVTWSVTSPTTAGCSVA